MRTEAEVRALWDRAKHLHDRVMFMGQRLSDLNRSLDNDGLALMVMRQHIEQYMPAIAWVLNDHGPEDLQRAREEDNEPRYVYLDGWLDNAEKFLGKIKLT
jgi:deoxyribodipyrimidine photolyase